MEDEQLIILGNGFDLSCGLKSTFQDFFIWINQSEDDNILQLRYHNYWICILEKAKLTDPTWFDVEGKLAEIIKFLINEFNSSDYKNQISTDGFGQNRSRGFFSFLRQKSRVIYNEYTQIYNETYSDTSDEANQKEFEYEILNNIVTSNFFTNNVSHLPKSSDDVFNFLYLELHHFESLLNDYLSEQVKQSVEYSEKSNEQINNLIKVDILKPIINSKILSFNYTTLFADSKSKFKRNSNKNVHGSIKQSNIILGVDKSLLQRNTHLNFSLIRFTKTYRTLQLQNKVSIIDGEKPFINHDIKVVKFFGHSLGIADYSYFQSIFDALDIYNKDVYLFFYYTNYDEIDRGPEQFNRVYKLMSDYGNTMSDVGQGQNLLHKLQLEGRISINSL